jgi:diguanylate cyclase (GGDEF)-like protein
MPHRVGHDPSTGLPDRLLLHDRLTQAVAHSHRRNSPLALVQIDLDGLQRCDELLGEGGRERLLRAIAARLRARLRASDTVARFDGERIALILPELAGHEAAGTLAGKIAATFEGGFTIGGHVLQPRPSLGIAVFPANGDNPAQLLRSAGLAAARARAAGVPVHRCATIERTLDLRPDLTHELGRAIERGQLRL